MCDSCWNDLPLQSGPLCLSCGEALGAHAFADENRAPGDWLCRPCRTVPPHFDRAVAYGLYRGTMRQLLHLLKYEGMEPVARRLGERLAALIAAQPALPQALTVVPVPLFGAKHRERGYNQAELLARAVITAARAHGLTLVLDTALLQRSRATQSQAGLTPAQRRANLRGAFYVPGTGRDPAVRGQSARDNGNSGPARKQPREISREQARLRGLDVLLIDDIYTTGATARAASQVLRAAGARSVWVATAARAQREALVPAALHEVPMHEDVAFWS